MRCGFHHFASQKLHLVPALCPLLPIEWVSDLLHLSGTQPLPVTLLSNGAQKPEKPANNLNIFKQRDEKEGKGSSSPFERVALTFFFYLF